MSADLTVAREYKRRAEQALPGRVAGVILYGSRARGDARPDSDWDIAVFVDGEVGVAEANALSDIGADLLYDLDADVHTVALPTSRRLDESAFLQAVRSEGIVL